MSERPVSAFSSQVRTTNATFVSLPRCSYPGTEAYLKEFKTYHFAIVAEYHIA